MKPTLALAPTLSTADYGVLVFYFVFMLSMGWVFKRFIKNTSDYFRSGGEMLWWIVGAGAFMTNFSAVSFTGMAGKAYQDGPVVLVIFVAGAIGFFFNYIYFAPGPNVNRLHRRSPLRDRPERTHRPPPCSLG